MTLQKYAILIFVALVFTTCVAVYIKTTDKKKRRLLPSVITSGILGVISLGVVLLLEFLCGNVIRFNLCTLFISFFLSIPGVAAMLFLNLI